jgi:uncharacterized sulfatase
MATTPGRLRWKLGLAAFFTGVWIGGPVSSAPRPQERPNILWITCEDLSPHLRCFGDMQAETPHLDRLARQGIRYTQAYATAPVCTPARSTLITGVYATSQGTQHLRGIQPMSTQLRCFTEYLRAIGYYCSNNVKEDYNFATPKTAWDDSSETAHWRGRRPDQPFFSIFNFMTTHQSRTRYGAAALAEAQAALSPGQRCDPNSLALPPTYPDTPEVRVNLAALYTQVTLMDRQAGDILAQLDADGLADNTIVFFYSDHGDGLPRGKRWLHDTGTRVPFIVRFGSLFRHWAPGAPGSQTGEGIAFIDLAPTVLSLAGLEAPAAMQGRAFLGPYRKPEPKYIFGIRDRVDEVLELSRSVRQGHTLYIRNYYPHRPRMQRSFFSEITPLRQVLRAQAAQGTLQGHEAWLMQPSVPPEELYDTQTDPHQFNNLASSASHRDLLQDMRGALREWIIETRDTAFLPEADMVARAGGHSPYDWARQGDVYPLAEILRVADTIGRGQQFLTTQRRALTAPDAAVRFWGANGLAAMGIAAQPALPDLKERLQDPSVSVRLAAAEALCHLDQPRLALPVIIQALEDDNVLHNLHASTILMAIADQARPALPAMRAALERLADIPDQGWYTRENLQYMIAELSS